MFPVRGSITCKYKTTVRPLNTLKHHNKRCKLYRRETRTNKLKKNPFK